MPAWTEKDDDLLLENVSRYQWPTVERIVGRSQKACKIRLANLGVSRTNVDGWYTTGQVARMFGVTRPTIQKWCNAGRLKSKRLHDGHRWRLIDPESIERLRHESKSTARRGD